ncbi:hypothetical protein GQ44DRAFT_775344 [Phaeosphaeriaceae sp. PMI808]|nr:hypothetical protein GQ44DRAFT_775344 [Phaeosphaeriaceae sp. PMI808]
MAALDPGQQHTEFVAWAEANGVDINGIAPARFIDRGMGIVAARNIKKGEKLVHVQTKSLVHVALPELRNLHLPANVSVHGKLAAAIGTWHCDPKHLEYKAWENVWPTRSDFQSTMPLYYSKPLQDLLPHAATSLLRSQLTRIERDWNDLSGHIPSVSKELFVYTWLIVNTRTFYWDYPDLPNSHPRLPKKRKQLTSIDCFTMCPFMDYFNHSDTGCDPQRDSKGYSLTADREYKAGDELCFSYGSHSNDFLLVEYGFIMDSNRNDSIPLDHLLLPLLSTEQTDALKEDGYYGNYTLSSGEYTVCHRTQVVLRIIVLDNRRYSSFVGGDDDGSKEQGRINDHLIRVLEKFSRKIVEILEDLERLETYDSGENVNRRHSKHTSIEKALVKAEHRDVLARRWKQIRNMVNTAVETLRG